MDIPRGQYRYGYHPVGRPRAVRKSGETLARYSYNDNRLSRTDVFSNAIDATYDWAA